MKTISLKLRLFIILVLFTIPLFNLQAKKWIVNVRNYSFFPYNLTHVQAKDTIQWVWEEGVHTTTSTNIPPDALDWDYPLTEQEPTAMVIPMVNGTYQYVCTPHAPEMNGTFTVSGATGIESPSDVPYIRVFPNPAAEQINVLTTVENIKSLRIFDMKGIEVGELSFGHQPRLFARAIDLGNYPTGVFFFEFTMESNRKRVVRVVHTGK